MRLEFGHCARASSATHHADGRHGIQMVVAAHTIAIAAAKASGLTWREK